jgi:hypothetical protein
MVAALVLTRAATRQRSPSLPVGPLSASYSVTYRVEQNGNQRWEVLAVQRPLRGSDLTYATAGPPQAGDQPVAGSLSAPTTLYAVNSTGVHIASGRQPGPPTNDELLAVDLKSLLARGLAQDRHVTRNLVGRSCRVLRLAEPPSGAIRRLDSTSADHDDVCLTPSGIVLAETWTYHGHVVLRRSAVAVRESVTDSTAAHAEPAPPDQRGATPPAAAAASITTDQTGNPALTTPDPPAGFHPWAPAVRLRVPDPQVPTSTIATSVTWAFVDGARIVTVEAGQTRGGRAPWSDGDTVTAAVALRGLGQASSALRSDGAEVRVDLGPGGWVRLRGTVAIGKLVAYANSLRVAG